MRRGPGGPGGGRPGGLFIFPFIIPIIGIFFVGKLFSGVIAIVLIAIAVIAVLGLLIGAISKGKKAKLNSNFNQSTTIHNNASQTSVHGNPSKATVHKSPSADLMKIDAKLNTYFKKNTNLPIVENIGLTTQKGIYTTLDELFITYRDEKIVTLGEFKEKSPFIYEKIISLLKAFSNLNVEVMKESVKKEDVKASKALSDAEKYIEKINSLNEAIPNIEITNGLYQTCDYLKQIDLASKESGKGKDKLTKLYDYYLPILIGILENYKDLNNSAVKTDEFKKCEAQLIKTITLINEALKSIYEGLHESDYMNLNADITTLQSLLKKDGLVDNDPFNTEDNDEQ